LSFLGYTPRPIGGGSYWAGRAAPAHFLGTFDQFFSVLTNYYFTSQLYGELFRHCLCLCINTVVVAGLRIVSKNGQSLALGKEQTAAGE